MFKPRQFNKEPSSVRHSFADATNDLILETSLPNATAFSGWELTKNDKYCVSRLPALPVLLESQMDEGEGEGDILNGYSDNATKFALLVGSKTINAWPYRSTDGSPITFEFPISGEENSEGLTLAILTRPSGTVALDPGLAVIETIAGKVRFYDSVQHAPALGIINSKNIETTVQLNKGEFITLAQNIEPAGIVVATNWKRVVLVTLRDLQGRPRLSTLELTGPLKASRLFSLFSSQLGPAESGDEVVSIRLGDFVNGSYQEIIVQDSKGGFKKLHYEFNPSGKPYIDHKKTLHYNLTPYLENSIDGVIPGALINTRFLGLWNLQIEGAEDLYTALVGVENSVNGYAEKNLLLVTLKVDQSGVLLYGSHQLPQVNFIGDYKPQLFIPSPSSTAFVVVGNSIIMTDMNKAFLQLNLSAEPTFSYYRPQWEDVVKLKAGVEVIGLGYEDKETESANPAVVVMTNNFGVIRVERFPESTTSKALPEDPTDPVYLLKSHMQQAIFYHQSEAVDFDVDPVYPLDTVKAATASIIGEVMNSLSSSLPPFFSSTRDSLLTRANALRELISFVQNNFEDFWFIVVPSIVEALEKLDASQHLWALLDAGTPEAALLKDKTITIIQDHHFVADSADIARSFFTYEAEKIDILVTGLLKSLQTSNHSDKTNIKILTGVLYEGVLKNEARYVSEVPEISPSKLWVLRTTLLEVSATAFDRAFGPSSKTFEGFTAQDRLDLVCLTESFYYIVTRAIQAMQDTDDAELDSYIKWFRTNRKKWVSALLKYGLIEEAQAITEKFQDFSSLAYILETERDSSSNEVVDEKLTHYIDVHGYEFAAKLFEHYIKTNQIQRLLLNFNDTDNYLDHFLRSNSKKYAQVAWIHHLQKKDFESASKILNSLASRKETDNQENRELSLSLAKLTAVAAKLQQPTSPDAIDLEESIIEAENNLVAVRIQNHLYDAVSLFVQNKKELITFDYFTQNFVNSKLQETFAQEAGPFFERFANLTVLSKEQLIGLLISVKPTGQFKGVFADALKVALSIGNDSEFQQQAARIWLTLLATTDDWSKITATSENTDDVNKARVHELVFFYTLSHIDGDLELYRILDEVVREPDASNGELNAELSRLVTEKSLKLWVDSIKAEVQNQTR